MRPHVVMHMGSSIDGRIVPTTWPKDGMPGMGEVYEQIHQQLKGDAWIVGRTTMAEFAKGEPRPVTASEKYPRTTWRAPGADTGPYAIAIDQSGKLHLNIARANGDALISITTEAVSDDYLAELRRDGISYMFAGRDALDLPLALEKLAAEFEIRTLLLEGGGGINGSFLVGGLIDEISWLIAPVADGFTGVPSLIDRQSDAPARRLRLIAVNRLEHDYLHLRYEVVA